METKNIDKSQGWKNILKLIIPYVLCTGIFQLIGSYFAGINLDDIANYKAINETTLQLFISVSISLIGTFGLVWLFRKYIDKKTLASLGFTKLFLIKDSLFGLLFGFIIIVTGFVCLLFTKQISFISIQFKQVELILSIGIFLCITLSEELLFRGYILNNLLISFNKYIAVFISSLLFCLIHAANPNFNFLGSINLFVAGIFFGLAYVQTRSLWFPLALHFSWNFFQGAIFGFNVSGKDTYSLIVTKNNKLNIWNGGNFGFEGSILSIIFQLFAIYIVYLIFKNRLTTDRILAPIGNSASNLPVSGV
jgi:membrane protease YdiL (CAAX protease family)